MLDQNLTEGPSFSNRTKKEFEQLASTPVFTETILRIEMPNGKILQSHFSPSEKVADVRREVEKVVCTQPALQRTRAQVVPLHGSSLAEARA